MDLYAHELHLTRSGFVGFMISQITKVVEINCGPLDQEKSGTGSTPPGKE